MSADRLAREFIAKHADDTGFNALAALLLKWSGVHAMRDPHEDPATFEGRRQLGLRFMTLLAEDAPTRPFEIMARMTDYQRRLENERRSDDHAERNVYPTRDE